MTHARATIEVIIYNVCDEPGADFKDKAMEIIRAYGLCGNVVSNDVKVLDIKPIKEQL